MRVEFGHDVPTYSNVRARLPCVRGRRAGREVTMATAMLGNGVYHISEAARLTGLRRERVREWFRGRNATAARPLFSGDYRPVRGHLAISFHDLVEVFIAGQLRDKGVSLQFLRRIHAQLKNQWATDHPFCRVEVRTDGKRIFSCQLDEHGRGDVVDVRTGQKVFDTILLPFLKKIDYDEATRLARRWTIAPLVFLDPAVGFGKPVVEKFGISTRVLSAAYEANGRDFATVAAMFGVGEPHVRAAVSFEARLAS
jgi:uncharacterized protein (DUF433 family)